MALTKLNKTEERLEAMRKQIQEGIKQSQEALDNSNALLLKVNKALALADEILDNLD